MTQLSELHKKTLASYIKKASVDVKSKASHAIDDLHRAKFLDYGDKIVKTDHRIKGIEKAADKLAKEEFVTELKKTTLGSYIKKASNEVGMSAYSAGLNTDVSRTGKGAKEHPGFTHAKKRIKGIEKAADKLTKEETEVSNMTKFVELASNKQAADFQTQLEVVMTQKVGAALETRKEAIASELFSEVIDESVEKVKGGYENIGKTGKKHGVFKSKKAAEKQKAAMFANGFKG